MFCWLILVLLVARKMLLSRLPKQQHGCGNMSCLESQRWAVGLSKTLGVEPPMDKNGWRWIVASPARNSFLEIPSVKVKWKIPSACRSYLAIFVWRLYSKHFFFGGGQYDLFNQSPGLDLEDTSHPMVCKQRKAKVPIRGGHRLSCPLLYLTGWKLYTGQSCNAQLLETSSLRFWNSFKLLHTYKYVCRRQSGQVVVWKGGKPHNKNIQGSTWDEGGYRYTR